MGLTVVGCGKAEVTPQSSPPSASSPSSAEVDFPTLAGPDTVLLSVQRVGGFGGPLQQWRPAALTLYRDGRLINTEVPQTAQFPGPASENFLMTTLSSQQVHSVFDKAVELSRSAPSDLGLPPVADVPTTRLTLTTTTGQQVVQAQALQATPPLPTGQDGLSAQQRHARERLGELVAQLEELASGVAQPPATHPLALPYQAQRIVALAQPYQRNQQQNLGWAALTWPGPALPGQRIAVGSYQGCVVVEGEQLRALNEQLRSASSVTAWVSGGSRWSLVMRPMLVQEHTCDQALASSQ